MAYDYNICHSLPTVGSIYQTIAIYIMSKYNTFGGRLIAIIIDSIILWPITFIEAYYEDTTDRGLFITISTLSSFIIILYFAVLHAKYGQTIGKKIMRIKITDIDEVTPLGFKRSMIRELPWIITSVVIVIYSIAQPDLNRLKLDYNSWMSIASISWMIIELITMLSNQKRRALHDYLAKSVVIKTI